MENCSRVLFYSISPIIHARPSLMNPRKIRFVAARDDSERIQEVALAGHGRRYNECPRLLGEQVV